MVTFPTFSQVVSIVQTKTNELASGLVDFGVGKPLYALTNAIADGYQYVLSLMVQVLANTRLATSDDTAADTFFADFQFTRNPAVTATGQVTFTPYNPGASSYLIVPGLTLKTIDGTLNYTVTEDVSNPLWNSGQAGYLVSLGTANATVPIQANAAGTAYNVQAGTISLVSGSLAGFSGTVSNQVGITNGVDAEATPAAIIRFWQFLNTRSQATQAAVEYAITTVQSGLTYSIVENPSERVGSFYVYVDDGSGSPNTALMSNISSAIDAVRPLCSTFVVSPPNVVTANITLSIFPVFGYNKTDLVGPVAQAITTLINGLGVSKPLAYFDVASAARGVEGVARIENLLLNGAAQDIGGGVADSVHVGGIAVN